MNMEIDMRRLMGWLSWLAMASLLGCGRGTSPGETLPGANTPGPGTDRQRGCAVLPTSADLVRLLREAPEKGEAGGLASGRFMWAAVVNRDGVMCAIAVSSGDPSATWPGSLGIAEAKAFTANAFSSDATPLSTARLYTLSQPGHSLWGIANGNPLNPDCLRAPHNPDSTGKVCGGTIAFGGGLPLYKGQSKVGGLGVSGDTSCTDHEIAKRVRDAAGLNPPKGAHADDILYSSVDGASVFVHPLCANTWRDGKKLGDELPSSGY
jgi:uncharacterized protein GlcG (DUF336 family)